MNIIVVDDERRALRTIERVIKNEMPDAEPVLFDKPGDALEYAKENRVDIAFLDIEMSGMNGLTLAKHLKEIYGKTNIIFLTGYREYAADAHDLFPAGYLLKPVTEENLRRAMENLRYPIELKSDKRIRVQTFGNFDVFVDGVAVRFPRRKSKELLAYLVKMKGTHCTIPEIAAELFKEGTKPNSVRVYVSAMIQALEGVEADNMVVRSHNTIAVDPSKFDCDYYRMLESDAEAVNLYTGEFMREYPWAELVTAYLDNKN